MVSGLTIKLGLMHFVDKSYTLKKQPSTANVKYKSLILLVIFLYDIKIVLIGLGLITMVLT